MPTNPTTFAPEPYYLDEATLVPANPTVGQTITWTSASTYSFGQPISNSSSNQGTWPQSKFAVGDLVRAMFSRDIGIPFPPKGFLGIILTLDRIKLGTLRTWSYKVLFDDPTSDFNGEYFWFREDELEFRTKPKRTSGFGKFIRETS